jgi:hypothetical protein
MIFFQLAAPAPCSLPHCVVPDSIQRPLGVSLGRYGGQDTHENPDRGPTVDWFDELRAYSATNNRFNPCWTKPDGGRGRCRSSGGRPREHAKHFWAGRSIWQDAADWLHDNSIWWDAGQQGRVAARGCGHPIGRYYDEQYTSDRSYPAAVNDIRECRRGAGFSDGHNDWNSLHPAIRLTSVSSSQRAIPIIIDWRTNPRVPAAGKVIVIEDATPASLVYRIE